MPRDCALGIAIGAGRLVAALVSVENPEDHVTDDVPFEGGTPDDVVSKTRQLVEQLSRDLDSGDGTPRILATGAAVPGQVDQEAVVFGPNLAARAKAWTDVPFVHNLEQEFGVPAVLENDVNAMLLHEQELGLGRGRDSFAVVYLAPGMTGLGSGIAINGELLRGCAGGAGEFGHLVVQPGGPKCVCGNRGCLEALVSIETILRNVNWGDRKVAGSLAEAARRVDRGDARAQEAFRQAGRWFGQGLSALVNLVNPPLVVIGGPEEVVGRVAKAGQGFRRQVRTTPRRSVQLFRAGYEETLHAYSFAELEGYCEIEIGSLSVERAAVGVAFLAKSVRERKRTEPSADEAARGALTTA
jgi:predicted NBD/HSP70 family sugar kinase